MNKSGDVAAVGAADVGQGWYRKHVLDVAAFASSDAPWSGVSCSKNRKCRENSSLLDIAAIRWPEFIHGWPRYLEPGSTVVRQF